MAKKKKLLEVSIGVFAYNEARLIGKTLHSLLKQKLDHIKIKEIVVVSSGSFDRTNQIVREYAKSDKRIRLLDQLAREGKSSAINAFLRQARSSVVVVISADLRVHTRGIEELCLPFFHEEVGMVGAHPIPVNTTQNSIGKQIRLLWYLHHLVALQSPKCGEMVAFRNVLASIPKESAVDEATIEVLLNLIGFKVVYAPRAIVYNRGPQSLSDFLKQRRRVYVGHMWVSGRYNYHVSTMKTASTLSVIRNYLLEHPEDTVDMFKLLSFEVMGRALGWFDFYILHKNPYIWNMVKR